MDYREITVDILTKSFVPVPNSTGFMLDDQNVITEIKKLNAKKEEVQILLNYMSKVIGVVMLANHQNSEVLKFDIKRVAGDLVDYL